MNRNVLFPRPLQYLLAIAEYGSYTRAAKALHVSQPTLSQQIKQLEETLQARLLDRSKRTVRLTNAGEVYLRHARRARGELDAGMRAINDVQDLSRGSLRLGWTPITDYLTCSLLENYNNRFPGITLSTLEMPQDNIEAAIIEDKFDFGIAFSKPFSADEQSSDIAMDMLFQEDLCLAVGNAHPLAEQEGKIGVEEFGRESLALLNTDFALRSHIDLYCLDHHIKPRVSIESNSLSVIIELIQAGPLATVLPHSIINTQCGLFSFKLSPEMPTKVITLYYRKEGYRSPACQAFLELAPEWAVRRLKEIPLRKRIPCPLSEPIFKGNNL